MGLLGQLEHGDASVSVHPQRATRRALLFLAAAARWTSRCAAPGTQRKVTWRSRSRLFGSCRALLLLLGALAFFLRACSDTKTTRTWAASLLLARPAFVRTRVGSWPAGTRRHRSAAWVDGASWRCGPAGPDGAGGQSLRTSCWSCRWSGPQTPIPAAARHRSRRLSLHCGPPRTCSAAEPSRQKFANKRGTKLPLRECVPVIAVHVIRSVRQSVIFHGKLKRLMSNFRRNSSP